MLPQLPTLLLARRPRETETDWSRARSFLGGAPRLGGAAWPRDKHGVPLHFLAQIAFADIARRTGPTQLPSTGSLAFFVGGEGAMVHLPEGRDDKPTPPPSDTPDLTKSGGESASDLDGRPLFPYWPIQFFALDVPPPPDYGEDKGLDERVETYRAAMLAAVEANVSRRQYNLSPDLAFAGPPIPEWWRHAIQLAEDLERGNNSGQGALPLWRGKHDAARLVGGKGLADAASAVEKLEAELAANRAAYPGFPDYLAEVTAWVAGRDPWATMAPADVRKLEAYWRRVKEFPKLTGYYGLPDFDWVKRDKLLRMLGALDDEAYALLPAHVRAITDIYLAPHPMWWHSATSFAARLRQAAEAGAAGPNEIERQKLEADRVLLASLEPRGMKRVFGSKDATEVKARIAAAEAKLAEPGPAEETFRAFAEEIASWAERRDPWSPMAPADIDRLKAAIARAAGEFKDIARHIVPRRIEDLEAATLRAMLTGSERAYGALPERVRERVNRECLLPPGVWHQMFGLGLEIQGDSSAMREDGNIMLLQLTYDDLMDWSFGDNGCYQFWIAPEDLARQRWSAVKLTFEMH